MVPGLVKTKAPRMTTHRGRTWDTCYVTMPDGGKGRGWFDTTWGSRFYVQHDGRWFAGRIAEFEAPGGGGDVLTVDLRHRRINT